MSQHALHIRSVRDISIVTILQSESKEYTESSGHRTLTHSGRPIPLPWSSLLRRYKFSGFSKLSKWIMLLGVEGIGKGDASLQEEKARGGGGRGGGRRTGGGGEVKGYEEKGCEEWAQRDEESAVSTSRR